MTASSDSFSVGPQRRAVVLVANPAAPYSRGLRIARALASAGYAVEIAAVAAPGLPAQETDGSIQIRRYRPSGPFAALAARHPGTMGTARAVSAADTAEAPVSAEAPELRPTPSPARADSIIRRSTRVPRRLGAKVRRRGMSVLRWILWPHTVRGWWATLAHDLPPADLYHACGSLTVAAALAGRDRRRRAGGLSSVIYDAIDDVFESNNVVDMPVPLRRWHARRERRWAVAADARTTVNDALSARLAQRWAIAERPVVVPNYPEVREIALDTDRIRVELGLPATTRIALFQGRLGPNLGLDEAAEAILLVPDAALVLIGFGRWWARSVARDREARFVGRHFSLAARHPDELALWTASADVSLVPLPPVSYNQRHATPNKFWESISVGTPVVIGPDLPVMDELVREDDLGVVSASLNPRDLSAAIVRLLDGSPEDAAARRRRIVAVARAKFSWPVAAGRYRDLVARVGGAPRGRR